MGIFGDIVGGATSTAGSLFSGGGASSGGLGGFLSSVPDFIKKNPEIIKAGIQTTGILVGNLLQLDAKQDALKQQQAVDEQDFLFQQEKDAQAREERRRQQELALALAAIEARAAAGQVGPGAEGLTRQAGRLQETARIEQQAVANLIAGFGRLV